MKQKKKLGALNAKPSHPKRGDYLKPESLKHPREFSAHHPIKSTRFPGF